MSAAPPPEPTSDDTSTPAPMRTNADRIGPPAHPHQPDAGGGPARLNWLRAGVLGATDGIVSVAGLVIGVADATTARGPIFAAELAGLVAGALSMALGEDMSVSSQRDSETAQLTQARRQHAETPSQELNRLSGGRSDSTEGWSDASTEEVPG